MLIMSTKAKYNNTYCGCQVIVKESLPPKYLWTKIKLSQDIIFALGCAFPYGYLLRIVANFVNDKRE